MFNTTTREDWEWLVQHAIQDERGEWRCKSTGAEIGYVEIARLVIANPFRSGIGVNCDIMHLFCPECMPKPTFPVHGTPLSSDQILKLVPAHSA